MSEQTIYIIDDDSSVRKGLTRLIKAAGLHAESYASAREFLDSGKLEKPGCIILDVQMPNMTGPELQEELNKTEYSMPIIFLSAHGDVPIATQTMKMGAVDFLTKPVDGNDLMEAIRISLKKDMVNREQRTMCSATQKLINTLTRREHEVLTYVITGILNKQVASEMAISEETVKIHRGRVMKKLGIVSVVELVRLCEKIGIVPAKLSNK
jgi:FixJ family two-component response regulator